MDLKLGKKKKMSACWAFTFFSFFRELSARRGHQVRVNHPLGKWDTNGPDFRQDLETYGTSRTQKAGECGDGDEAGCGGTDY